jgi:hypothetical protein
MKITSNEENLNFHEKKLIYFFKTFHLNKLNIFDVRKIENPRRPTKSYGLTSFFSYSGIFELFKISMREM